ncbi:hypothetical protein, partial [Parahaliea aestuarii]
RTPRLPSNNANPASLRSDGWQLCSGPGGSLQMEWVADFSGIRSQAINPYSYVLNNPLSGVDPTGYVKEDIEKKVVRVEKTGSRIQREVTVTTSTTQTDNGTSTTIHLDGGLASEQQAVSNGITGAAQSAGFNEVAGTDIPGGAVGGQRSRENMTSDASPSPSYNVDKTNVSPSSNSLLEGEGRSQVEAASAGFATAGVIADGIIDAKPGRVGITSKMRVSYSPMGTFKGNQHVVMRDMAKGANAAKLFGLTPAALSVDALIILDNYLSGGTFNRMLFDVGAVGVGVRFPLVGATQAITPYIGPRMLDAAIKIGPQPTISPAQRYDNLREAIDYMYQ